MPEDTTTPPDQPPAKPRRWRRRLAWVLFLFVVLAWVVNGPLFRWGVKWGLQKALATQEISGPFTVQGSLWSGAALTEVDLTCPLNATKLKAKHAHVH